MIQKLQIKGFRSLRDVSWEPGKLNVLIGPNGSGKSNLLRALSLLQRSAQGGLSETILRQGGIGALLWDGQAQELSWSISTDALDLQEEGMTYELRLRQLGTTSAYRVEYESLAGERPKPLKSLERRPGHAEAFDAGERALVVGREGSCWSGRSSGRRSSTSERLRARKSGLRL